jgi:hypothetical protein
MRLTASEAEPHPANAAVHNDMDLAGQPATPATHMLALMQAPMLVHSTMDYRSCALLHELRERSMIWSRMPAKKS